MTYTFSRTTFNDDTKQYQTGVIIDGEIICFMCDEKPEESMLRARIAGMLMAIEESHDKAGMYLS